MKYFLAWAAGLAFGVALACAALYYNPFVLGAKAKPSRNSGSDWSLAYSLPGDDLLTLTHSEHAPLAVKPAGIGFLWEGTIRSSTAAALTLQDSDSRPAAFAALLAMPSARTDLLAGRALVEDYWLVTVPGQGSLFVRGLSNLWPFLKDTVLPVTVLGRPWRGPRVYRPTVGPGPGGTALVLGATGRFTDARGTAVEEVRVSGYSRAKGPEALAGGLTLRLGSGSETAPGAATSAAQRGGTTLSAERDTASAEP